MSDLEFDRFIKKEFSALTLDKLRMLSEGAMFSYADLHKVYLLGKQSLRDEIDELRRLYGNQIRSAQEAWEETAGAWDKIKTLRAEIERKDEALQKLKDLLTEVVNSPTSWQATDERMWTVDVQLSKQLIEDIKQALSTKEEGNESH